MKIKRNVNNEFITITKFLDVNNSTLRGFKLEVNNFTTFECLFAAAYIVNEMEAKAPTEIEKNPYKN